jgi:ActR/RegA family two-component response regulator
MGQLLYGTPTVESTCTNVLALRFGCMLCGEMAERTEQQAILVVEDDVPLLQAVERTFREAGRTVVACSTFEEGRKALRTHRFAGLLTDVRLGAFNGLQLAVIARQLQPDMRLIVYSGFDDPVLRAEAERLRAIYVVKPITAGQLLRLFEAQTAAPESKDVPS